MTDFDLQQSPYIAIVHRSDLEITPDDPVQAAIYAPSTICAYFIDHDRRDGVIHALLLDTRDGWALVGPDCFQSHYPDLDPRPWIVALDRLHPIAGTGLDHDWRSSTRRDYWRLVQVMGLMLQVEPGHKMLRDLLTRATQGDKAQFTLDQKRVLLEILRERGGLAVTRGPEREAWDKELSAHRKVAKQRRDHVFRLARLASLDLPQSDAETVESLHQACTGWRHHRMGQLSPGQVDLVKRFEKRHFDQRWEASEALARALGESIGEQS
jgi:hypothetical protein